MYSLLMMSALAAGPETTEFNGFFRRLFSVHGGGSGSCSGSRAAAPQASCTGSRSAGSCSGSRIAAAPSGCCGSGYYSSCAGSGMTPGYAEPGMTPYYFAAPTPSVSYVMGPVVQAGGGCFGSSPAFPTPAPPGSFAEPPQAVPQPAVPLEIDENRTGRRVGYAANPTRGTVVIRLPADARLYAEGRLLTTQTGGRREFVTPPLPPGEYGYTFRAEYTRDGQTVGVSKQVAVRPGATAVVEFADLIAANARPPVPLVPAPESAAAVTAAGPVKPTPAAPAAIPPAAPAADQPARITVKLPAGAVLYVDGRKSDRADAVRRFDTPPLAAGREFGYEFKVELTRGGRPETQSERVTVRAGQATEVDFTTVPQVAAR